MSQRKVVISLCCLIGILVVARLLLPMAILKYANQMLRVNGSYSGHIADVDVHLWRGAYVIRNLEIFKSNGNIPVPFIAVQSIDLAVSWPALRDWAIVARLKFHKPVLNFVDAKQKENRQDGTNADWIAATRKLAPISINQIVIDDGNVHFLNFQAEPRVDIWMHHIQGELTNLTNSKKSAESRYATCALRGITLGDGRFDFNIRLDPLQKASDFDLKARLIGVHLPKLNAFFKKYASLDFEEGRADFVSEVGVNKGTINGYVKPLFRDVKVFSFKKDIEQPHENILQIAWKGIVQVAADIFKNQPKNQIATKIPLEGKVKAMDTDVFAVIGGVLHNAFIQAYSPLYESAMKDSTSH